jgi:phenylacetate-CoA ligase
VAIATLHTRAAFDPYFEFLPRARLRDVQFQRLCERVRDAFEHVPYYRERFRSAGVRTPALTSIEDIRHLPLLDKSELRECYPFRLLAVPREKVVRLHASSGTTGKPTVVGYTAGDIDIWAGLMARCLVAGGVRRGDIVHNAYYYGLFTGGFGIHYGAERLGCSVTPVSGGNTERQVMLLRDFGAHVLAATPSYALNIAETAARLGVDLASGPLATGLFGGEPCSPGLRAELERRLGLRVAEQYGLSEIMGPGVAGECPAQAGLHGWEDHFLFEIIDPASGEPLPPGATGELVITTLTREAQPMIRYRTRDITRLIDEPCACGREHVRIERILGRDDDMLIIRGVNIYPSQIEAVLMGFPGLAPHYQLLVTRDGILDRLCIQAEPAPGAAPDRGALARAVAHHVKSLCGVSCDVEVVAPGTLPRSEGKAVRVRDRRPRSAATTSSREQSS